MPKYAFLGGYTAESWAHLIANPETRRSAVEKAADAVGARVDTIYWSFGDDDFLVILDAADDNTAAAIAVAVSASGALRNTRTVRLITADDLTSILAKAKTVAGAYVPPGARQPVGV